MIDNEGKTNFYNQTWRLNHLYKIIDKEKKEVTFRMNKAQQILRYIKKLDKQKRGCVRLIILKARQLGITTNECIEKLDKALFYPNRNLKLSAHNQDKAIEIFEIIKFAYNRLPGKIVLKNGVEWIKPRTKYMTKSTIRFAETNSKIEVVLDTRSGTPSDVHSTELAFVENAKDMITGTLPSIPKTGNFTIESTANGAGGQFYDMRKKNYNNTKGTFTCIFFPRFIEDGYRLPLEDGEKIELPRDLEHLKKYNLEDEQLKWYIQQYFDLGDKVFQENPSNPEEAFLSSGRLFFNMGIVKRLLDIKYEVDEKYRQNECKLLWYNGYGKGTEITEDALFGVDTSEGTPDGDSCSIKVRSRRDYRLICSFNGRIPPDELCDVIEHILEQGISGIIGIERNNTGLVTIKEAKSRWRYYMLYKTSIEDQATRKKTKKIGFTTNSATRPLILGELEKLVRQGHIKEIDHREKAEMGGFVYNSNGKPEANEGNHDDDIMADAICCYMINEPQQINMSDSTEIDFELGKQIE